MWHKSVIGFVILIWGRSLFHISTNLGYETAVTPALAAACSYTLCMLALVLDDGNNLTSVRLNPGTLPESVTACSSA